MRKSLLILASVVFFLGAVGRASAVPIDLTSWTAVGGGNWNVQSGGTEVLQTINGSPAYFLSNSNYINTQFDGSFEVETTSDNDYIGFVFGYNSQNDFLLFDWKQGNQGSALEGYTLARISGSSVNFWNHTGSGINVLATDYSTVNGWADNTVYGFTLDYTPTNIQIAIGGSPIFNVNGSFSDGKFGFYNYSQKKVRYQGFEEEVIVAENAPIPEPTIIVLLGIGLVGLAGGAARRKWNMKAIDKS